MNGLRKTHTKSRNGCRRCKERKVRCDLRPPICSNCQRRGEVCDYSTFSGQCKMQPTSKPSPSNSTDLSLAQQVVLEEALYFRIPISFELGIHFDASTSATFDLPETPAIWRRQLVRGADSQSYLRHGSLALAALHTIHLRPTQSDVESLYRNANVYQNEAYALFRRDVQTIDDTTGPAVLAFTLMTVIFNFSTSLVEYASCNGGGKMDVIGPLRALRSGARLIDQYRNVTVHHQLLGGALGRFGSDLERCSSLPVNPTALEALEKAVVQIEMAGCSTPATAWAFAGLRKTFTQFPSEPRGWIHVILWPRMLLEEYLDELEEGQPAAIIAFVYWCGYLSNSLQQWYLETWPTTAASHEIMKLSTKWDDILGWPRERLGLPCV